MSTAPSTNDELATRVLLLTPTKKDGEITAALLAKAGAACFTCRDLEQLADEIPRGAGCLLLTEEVFGAAEIQVLLDVLRAQPPWSDIPVVMLMRSGVASPAAAKVLHDLSNVTLLERPAPTRSVASAVQAAIRGRQRQFQIRDQIEAIRAGQHERDLLLESERAARQAAERADRLKDDFLATLSHELRTPLNAIYGWVQLIKLSPDDGKAVTEGMDVIDRNVRVQTQLIEDLLDVSRIISGKVRLDVKRVDLAEVLTAALDSVMPALLAKEIRLEKVIDTLNIAVSGDPARLQQVFWNLLTNAAKFTPRGGKVQVIAERVGSHIETSIVDSGEGIDPKFLPQLFERFSQADGSTTRSHGGLGLGLSIVKNLVEMHGGTITASSPGVNLGATFTVGLPIRTLARSDKEAHSRLDPRHDNAILNNSSQLKGLKILVVDDEADSRDLVGRVLTGCEAIPALAASAGEAQSLLLEFAPHVIVSDIGMPVQDGYSFMRAVRSQGVKTPALALTAFARPEDRIRAIQAGYQMHLRKPVDPAELVAVIASLAGRYDAANRN